MDDDFYAILGYVHFTCNRIGVVFSSLFKFDYIRRINLHFFLFKDGHKVTERVRHINRIPRITEIVLLSVLFLLYTVNKLNTREWREGEVSCS